MKFVKITVIKVYIIVLVFNLIHVYLLFEQLQLDLIKLLWKQKSFKLQH